MDTVMIVVRSDGTAPQYLVERQRIWYDLSPPPLTDAAERDALRIKVGEELVELMKHIQSDEITKPPDRLTHGDVMAQLRTIGRAKLFQKVLPDKLQVYLKMVADRSAGGPPPTLLIRSSEDWPPWEIMHDGTSFLGLRFQIARLPISRMFDPNEVPIQDHPVSQIVSLLGNDVLDAALLADWVTTFDAAIHAGAHEFRRPSADGAAADFPSIATLDGQSLAPDILHITCHGDWKMPSGELTWTLDHNLAARKIDEYDMMSVGEYLNFAQQRPLVFGNACASALAGNGSSGCKRHSFGSSLFDLGASAFVGTFAPISKRRAVEFAREFYTHLLVETLPIGKALWAAKTHFHGQVDPDPSWLFYSLYGPPETRFTP